MSDMAHTIRKKVQRAEEHFENFHAALGLSGSPIDGGTPQSLHVNPNRQLEYRTEAAIPGTEHGIIIGDIVHQLRSCLDHIVYAMVKPLTADPEILRKVQFPIFDQPAKFMNSPGFVRLEKTLGPMSREIAAIQRSQPYNRTPASPKEDSLWIVSELDNIDKHRTILVLNPAVSVYGSVITDSGEREFSAPKQPIKAGTAVLNIGWPLPDPPFEMHVKRIAPFIVFAETDGLCDNLSVFHMMGRLIRDVGHVITIFEAEGFI